jgi:hypothetical protein
VDSCHCGYITNLEKKSLNTGVRFVVCSNTYLMEIQFSFELMRCHCCGIHSGPIPLRTNFTTETTKYMTWRKDSKNKRNIRCRQMRQWVAMWPFCWHKPYLSSDMVDKDMVPLWIYRLFVTLSRFGLRMGFSRSRPLSLQLCSMENGQHFGVVKLFSFWHQLHFIIQQFSANFGHPCCKRVADVLQIRQWQDSSFISIKLSF